MTVQELSREQLQELKCTYYGEDHDLSYGEIAAIDDIVSDEEIFGLYDATEFTEDDFFCSAEDVGMDTKSDTLKSILEGERALDTTITNVRTAETLIGTMYKDLFDKYVKDADKVIDIDLNHDNSDYREKVVVYVQWEKQGLKSVIEAHVLDAAKLNIQLEHHEGVSLKFILDNCKYDK